jgi:membrane fusion protein, copper/silver efflux system
MEPSMKKLLLMIVLLSLPIALLAQAAADNPAVKISITPKGFDPPNITLKKDVATTITFLRQTSDTCATSIQIPEYKIKRDLPLNTPVSIEITPAKTGEFTFMCGMNMIRGSLVVVEK